MRLAAWAATESIKVSHAVLLEHMSFLQTLCVCVCVCVCLKVLIVKSWADPKDWRPSGEGASSKGHVETVRRQ